MEIVLAILFGVGVFAPPPAVVPLAAPEVITPLPASEAVK